MRMLFIMISQVIILSCLVSCSEGTKQQKKEIARDSIKEIQASPKSNIVSVAVKDTIGKYFHSEGVVNLNSDSYLKDGFELLNEDGSSFLIVKPHDNKLIVGKKEFDLDQFQNNDSLPTSLQFAPYSFYPDNSVFIFEYLLSDKGEVLVLINKEKKIVKHIKLNTTNAAVQPWSKHLIGAIVGFDVKDNPVLEQPDAKAGSLDATEDNVFIIEDIAGEWVKIACTEMCAVPCGKQLKNGGWIKWRSGDKVLISLYYDC